MLASCKHNVNRRHGIVSLIVMSVPLSMGRYNHLHGIKGHLRDVEVLAAQQMLAFLKSIPGLR